MTPAVWPAPRAPGEGVTLPDSRQPSNLHKTLRQPALICAGLAAGLMLAAIGLGLSAGATVSQAQPQATAAAGAASTLEAICRASDTSATAIAQAAAQCQAIAAVTPTPTRSAVQQAAATPTPPALVVFAAPSVKTNLVGAVVAPAGVPLRGLYSPIFGDRVALGMDNLFDTTVGTRNGDGIADVIFTIVDPFGAVVHQVRTGRPDRFCAFGGSTPACRAWDFAANDWRWPSGATAHSGRFRVFAFAQGDNPAHKGTWQSEFEIRLSRDGQQELDGAVKLLGVATRAGRYIVAYATLGFTPDLYGIRVRFYFDGEDPAQVGPGVEEVPAEPGQVSDGIFSGFTVRSRPTGARAICAIGVQPDGSLILESRDCVALP